MDVAFLGAASLAFAEHAARSATINATASHLARTATAPRRHLHYDVGRLDHTHRLVADLEVELLGGLSSHQADKPMRTRDELDNRGHAITLNARHDAGEAISRGLGNDRPPNGFPAPRREPAAELRALRSSALTAVAPRIATLAIIGVGLVGGSFALALKAAGRPGSGACSY